MPSLEIANKIAQLLQREEMSTVEEIVSLLKELSTDQRADLCVTPFSEFPAYTPLTAFIAQAGDMGPEPLRALLLGLNSAQRLVAYQFVPPEEQNKGLTAFAIAFTAFGIGTQEIVSILFDGISDPHIHLLLQQQGFFPGINALTLEIYLALTGKSDDEPFRSYAQRQQLDKQALITAAYDTPLIDDLTLGFKILFSTQRIVPADFSLEARKRYFLGAKHYLYFALLDRLANYSSEEVNGILLDQWLDGFTSAEKLEALNPAGLAPIAGNPLMIIAYVCRRPDLIKYLQAQGVHYPARLRIIEIEDLRSAISLCNREKINALIKDRTTEERFILLSTPLTSADEIGNTLFSLAVVAVVNKRETAVEILADLLRDLSADQRVALAKTAVPALGRKTVGGIAKEQAALGNLQLLQVLNLSSDEKEEQSITVASPTLDQIVALLAVKFDITEAELDTLRALNKEDLRQVNIVVTNLNKTGLLNLDSFRMALARITEDFKAPEPVPAVKTSRRETGHPRSTLQIGDITVYPDPDKSAHLSGGNATAKMATAADGNTYVIKKANQMRNAYQDIFQIVFKEAIKKDEFKKDVENEVVYSSLLDRQPAHLYYSKKHNTARFFGVWLPGTSLRRLSEEEITSQPYHTRLRYLASGLADLNTLHRHHRIHGDVSDGNFIINFENVSMKLIDFASAHRIGISRGDCTPLYNEPGRNLSNDIFRDLFAMGLICAQFFPELFRTFGSYSLPIIQIKVADLMPVEQAIVLLIDALMNPDLQARCTSEEALNFCNALIERADSLDDRALEEISSETISNKTPTIEKIVRSVMCV